MSATPFDPIFIAYAALGFMAVLPIWSGSRFSLKDAKDELKSASSEQLSKDDAYLFPVIGSAFLFSFYLLFTFFPKEYINYLLTAYFALFGTFSLVRLVVRLIDGPIIPNELVMKGHYHLVLQKPEHEPVIDVKITWLNVAVSVLAIAFTAYYVWTKNWIASNIFGLSFAISAISLIQLDSFATGMILLAGLFAYDVFWVFGTNVMVKVAKSFDVPVKLLFPRDVLTNPMAEFTMLGLGDIVIPGVFVSLCLKFDDYLASKKHPAKHKVNGIVKSAKTFPKPYFYTSLIFYIIGLAVTMTVMHTFKAAQPALLYLSPACILSALLVAGIKGELKDLFAYTTEKPEEKKSDSKAEGTNQSPSKVKSS